MKKTLIIISLVIFVYSCIFVGGCIFICSKLSYLAVFFRRPGEVYKPQSQQQLLEYLMSGFGEENYPRLYYDTDPNLQSRILLLRDYLGYESNYGKKGFQEYSNGDKIILTAYGWGTDNFQEKSVYEANYTYQHLLILSKDKPPEVKIVPLHSYLDSSGDLIAWRVPDERGLENLFKDGSIIKLDSSFMMGYDFFTSGYQDDSSAPENPIPIDIYSVKNPKVPIIRSKLKRCPDWIRSSDKYVFLMDIIPGLGQTPSDLNIEVYERDGDSLVYKEHFIVKCPRIYGASHLWLDDFDSVNNRFIFHVVTSAYCPQKQFFYDYETKTTLKMKSPEFKMSTKLFLNREVFKNTVKYVESDKFSQQ